MASLVSAVIALLCFVLAAFGVSVAVDLLALGLAFLALSMVLGNIPALRK